MKVLTTKAAIWQALSTHYSHDRIGLVPTMGNLHAGHLALVDRASQDCNLIVASLFVNPLQFGAGEDFEGYPRTFDRDCALLVEHGTDFLFAPTDEEMYSHGKAAHTTISVPALTDLLCGETRPGHFDGVATVVAKLINIVRPHVMYLGEKDWQQVAVIRAMVRDIDIPVNVVAIPTVRDDKGLALSSRNSYLTDAERVKAPMLHSTLLRVRERVLSGDTHYDRLEAQAKIWLADEGFVPDYVSVRESASLQRATDQSKDRRVFGAAHLGKARLIDNIAIDP